MSLAVSPIQPYLTRLFQLYETRDQSTPKPEVMIILLHALDLYGRPQLPSNPTIDSWDIVLRDSSFLLFFLIKELKVNRIIEPNQKVSHCDLNSFFSTFSTLIPWNDSFYYGSRFRILWNFDPNFLAKKGVNMMSSFTQLECLMS